MYKEFDIKERLYFSIWEQWGELFAKRGYNWKNFSVIELSFEYSDHLYPKGSFEILFQLLGFGIRLQYVSDKPRTEEMEHLVGLMDQVLKGEVETYKWDDIKRSSSISHDNNNDEEPIGWC